MMKVFSVILCLCTLLFIPAQTNCNNIVVAHRGAWKSNGLPENSMASLTKAIEMMCAGAEFDVRMTADSVLVVNHDPYFFGLEIEKVKYNELTAYSLENGEKIPTLESYILAGKMDNHATRLVLEVKPSEISKERGRLIAREVIKKIRELNAEEKVDYISFDLDILIELLRFNPDITTQYLKGDRSPKQLKDLGITGLDYHYQVFYQNPEWIIQAKALQMTLNVWTVNDTTDMEFFLGQGFDYITTNEPELLLNRWKKSTTASDWNLIWSDEFDFEGLPDETKWSYDVGGHGWGNNEKQYYLAKSKENSVIKDGKLHIIALKKDVDQCRYTSAKLTTYQKLDIQYGKIEVKAKLPKGYGSWPAIWMLPLSIKTNREHWPLCGEIDIMEHVGRDPNVVHTSLHTELYNHIKGTQITFFDTLTNVFDAYHTYGVEWDEKSIRFIYDDKIYFESHKGQNGRVTTNEGWPFDKPYFLILNVAVGGNWGGPIDENSLPYEMVVDYVRVYKKVDH